jgi:bifunctional polynucleotide phosphatase/kinase
MKRKASTRIDENNKKKKNQFELEWTQEETFYALTSKQIKDSDKVLAFDMDHTLVSPKSGKVFPTGRNDWEWTFEEIPEVLKTKYNEGYKIIIFTNQAGFEKGKVKEGDIKGKILDLCDELGYPIKI